MGTAGSLEYELIDFGARQKLERLGQVVVSRPAPRAEGVARHAEAWRGIAAEFCRTHSTGEWRLCEAWPLQWHVAEEGLLFSLEATASGQVGFFPEQATVRAQVAELCQASPEVRVLDLFAYSGASSLSALRAGAHVTCVDSSRSAIRRAKENALLNGLSDAPLRTYAEDARRFVAREERRGSKYDIVVLDPPSFGRGLKGEVWKLTRDLPELLGSLQRVLSEDPVAVFLSAHTVGLAREDLARMLDRAFRTHSGKTSSEDLTLRTLDGRSLPSGALAVRRFRS